jgi:uncharacterized protein YebE (UPF0316 family)
MNLLLTFILLNIANVIIQTIKSIATIKCGKTAAAVVNAVAYGLYTIVTVYMLCELPLWWKAGIVALCNLVGVWVVKYFEEKARKDKLWKVEATIPAEQAPQMLEDCKYYGLTYNYVDINKYYLFNFYCPTQKDSTNVHNLLKSYDAKYFVSESKNL